MGFEREGREEKNCGSQSHLNVRSREICGAAFGIDQPKVKPSNRRKKLRTLHCRKPSCMMVKVMGQVVLYTEAHDSLHSRLFSSEPLDSEELVIIIRSNLCAITGLFSSRVAMPRWTQGNKVLGRFGIDCGFGTGAGYTLCRITTIFVKVDSMQKPRSPKKLSVSMNGITAASGAR